MGHPAILSISAFAFLIMAFEPFRMGWKAWLYSFGIAVLTPLLVDKTLEAWENRGTSLWRAIVTTACLAAFGAQLLLAVVRGNIMRQQVANPAPAIVIEDDTVASEKAQNDFYDESLGYLQLVMVLFAGALELGAGVAWREARRWGTPSCEDRETLWARLGETRQQMIQCAYSASVLEAEGAAFEAQFRRDFDRSLLKRTRNGLLNKHFLGTLLFILISLSQAWTADRLNLVIAVDLSKSVTSAKGFDGKSEFDRNITAITRLLNTVPPGSRITIIGITDRSYSRPYVLLAAELDQDPGYFNERIVKARQSLVSAWQRRIPNAVSHFQHTDIFGSISIAAQLFAARNDWHNVLVIFSDMRHEMPGMSPESFLDQKTALRTIEKQKLIPALPGVDVHVLGADTEGRTTAQWQRLREFWTDYFKRSGGTLMSYSVLRDVPQLTNGPQVSDLFSLFTRKGRHMIGCAENGAGHRSSGAIV